jgi:hypothetical protein
LRIFASCFLCGTTLKAFDALRISALLIQISPVLTGISFEDFMLAPIKAAVPFSSNAVSLLKRKKREGTLYPKYFKEIYFTLSGRSGAWYRLSCSKVFRCIAISGAG